MYRLLLTAVDVAQHWRNRKAALEAAFEGRSCRLAGKA
jgi:hypothetical protein